MTPQEAAEVARKHGLGLPDAAALLTLADTTDEADRIAAQFAGNEAQQRDMVRKLFAPQDTRPQRVVSKVPDPKPGGDG